MRSGAELLGVLGFLGSALSVPAAYVLHRVLFCFPVHCLLHRCTFFVVFCPPQCPPTRFCMGGGKARCTCDEVVPEACSLIDNPRTPSAPGQGWGCTGLCLGLPPPFIAGKATAHSEGCGHTRCATKREIMIHRPHDPNDILRSGFRHASEHFHRVPHVAWADRRLERLGARAHRRLPRAPTSPPPPPPPRGSSAHNNLCGTSGAP